jgi:hypothetical protein
MKIYLLLLSIIIGICTGAVAQPLNLTNPQELEPDVSQRVIWENISIFPTQKKMIVYYMWVTPSGDPISVGGSTQQRWVCRDIETPGTNAECTSGAPPTPYPCCTGVGTGTCNGLDVSCFSDIFSSEIQCPAHDGIPIGAGLRTLLKNQWRDEQLSPGNDGTFE